MSIVVRYIGLDGEAVCAYGQCAVDVELGLIIAALRQQRGDAQRLALAKQAILRRDDNALHAGMIYVDARRGIDLYACAAFNLANMRSSVRSNCSGVTDTRPDATTAVSLSAEFSRGPRWKRSQ
jgi:hypothetical protein